MIKAFFFTIILCTSIFSAWAQFPNLGNLQERTYEVSLPLAFQENEVGLIKVRLQGEKLKEVDGESYSKILNLIVKKEYFREIKGWIKANEAPYELRYNPELAVVEMTIPQDKLKPNDLDLSYNPQELYAGAALAPAPIGGAINYRLEKASGSTLLGGESFTGFFDSFVNIKGFVLESQFNYNDDATNGRGWFRGDTRIVKDIPSTRIRTEAGDVYPQPFGFMSARPIGGVKLAKNFSLDPYRIPFPQGAGQFTLRTRSQVKTFVNGVLIRDEILPAGNYDLRDVPLINGLNTVLVETTDELGQKQVFEFRLPTSVGLLKEGENNFSISHGRPFTDKIFRRTYSESELTSVFYQHGLSSAFSLGGYAQNEENFRLGGLELGMASNLGNFFLGAVAQNEDQQNAGAGSITWQLQSLGSKLFNSYTLTLRHERFGDGFKNQKDSVNAALKSQTQSNITVPIRELFTTSLGATYGEVRNTSLENRHSFDAALNIRAWRNLNLNFFISRARDEYKKYNDVAYAFFTFTFDGANHFISGFHDIENKTNRITAVKDNGNRLYDPRLTAVVDEGPTRQGAEVDGFVPTPVADFGGRLTAARLEGDSQAQLRTVGRVSSAIVFAYDQGNFGLGFSRPVPNSFVLFKPSENLKKQKVSLRSTSPFAEGESGPLGEITFTNILPYQFREIQLDPTGLDLGTSLEQEKFVIYPSYRSAHLIPLKDKGALMIQGTLTDKRGRPLPLKVGSFAGKPFFTSRQGHFFIEGLSPGEFSLEIDDFAPKELSFTDQQRGVINLGVITLEGEEE